MVWSIKTIVKVRKLLDLSIHNKNQRTQAGDQKWLTPKLNSNIYLLIGSLKYYNKASKGGENLYFAKGLKSVINMRLTINYSKNTKVQSLNK